ncbi:MAG: FHA domain-containing protein [Planctomycetaceae bacterium]|nr:FHA domain-containing protein [Planctomycetaceae bacterium]
MAQVTLSVLEGLERGRVYTGLDTPVTIGREDDNTVQLNDERISRVHAKIQEDRGQVILTDLNSTNGSRVNGHPVQLRVLQPGDHLQIGRCILLYGSDEQILEHARRLGVEVSALAPLTYSTESASGRDSDSGYSVVPQRPVDGIELPLFPGGAPDLPLDLSPGDRARLCDVLAFIHERLRDICFESAETQNPTARSFVDVPWNRWQNMMQLEKDIAAYLRQIADTD